MQKNTVLYSGQYGIYSIHIWLFSPWIFTGEGEGSEPPSAVGVEATDASPDQLALGLTSRLRRGLRGCLGSGMREGGALGGEPSGGGVGDDGDETEDGKAATGEEESRGGSTSSSSDDLLLLARRGEPGGDGGSSPRLLAMELAVGLM